jgi:hypothetical protein
MHKGRNKLLTLQKWWKAESFVFCLLLSVSVGLPAFVLLGGYAWFPAWGGILVWVMCFMAACLLFPYWKVTVNDVAKYLDRRLPELEESCALLLRPEEELGILEKLQAARTKERLAAVRIPRPLLKRLLMAVGSLAIGVLLSITLLTRGRGMVDFAPAGSHDSPGGAQVAGIRSVSIRIVPPAYTGHIVRQQNGASLRVEEGSLVSWELETEGDVHDLQLLFNDSLHLRLQAANPQHTVWRATRPAVRSGFYQFSTDGRLSEPYALEVIKDEPPHITIVTPKPYTVVDYGESTKIPLVVKLRDDYGIADALVVATVASGSGEAVKFKEQSIRFGERLDGGRASYDLQQVIDLTALGMRPGDELYFYCRAKDNHGQESRTDMYIISLPDTAQLMSLEGLTMSVDVKPEYFRSERQIIIETEQLLKEKDTIPLPAFHDRSNNLGIDQKLLRLRYGKFLGEEAEVGQAEVGPAPDSEGRQRSDGKGRRRSDGRETGGADPGELGSGSMVPGKDAGRPGGAIKPGDAGDASKILDAYTDKHDNAEDATYFEPTIKEQLKATLSEMWKAELRLRTYQPREALPYAYKALRLLKDLQQKSRAYVAKTGVRVTPWDPAKRLAGKLDDIAPPVQRLAAGRTIVPSPEKVLRIALGLLEVPVGEWGKGPWEILQEAMRRLGREASEHPEEYLKGYRAIRRILDGEAGTADVLAAQQAIRKLLPDVEAAPFVRGMPADEGLSGLYFHHINDPAGKP